MTENSGTSFGRTGNISGFVSANAPGSNNTISKNKAKSQDIPKEDTRIPELVDSQEGIEPVTALVDCHEGDLVLLKNDMVGMIVGTQGDKLLIIVTSGSTKKFSKNAVTGILQDKESVKGAGDATLVLGDLVVPYLGHHQNQKAEIVHLYGNVIWLDTANPDGIFCIKPRYCNKIKPKNNNNNNSNNNDQSPVDPKETVYLGKVMFYKKEERYGKIKFIDGSERTILFEEEGIHTDYVCEQGNIVKFNIRGSEEDELGQLAINITHHSASNEGITHFNVGDLIRLKNNSVAMIVAVNIGSIGLVNCDNESILVESGDILRYEEDGKFALDKDGKRFRVGASVCPCEGPHKNFSVFVTHLYKTWVFYLVEKNIQFFNLTNKIFVMECSRFRITGGPNRSDNSSGISSVSKKQYDLNLSGILSTIKTNSDKRVYTCQTCDKTFKKLQNLRNHRLQHSGLRPYTCARCHKKFNRPGQLREHMRKKHRD